MQDNKEPFWKLSIIFISHWVVFHADNAIICNRKTISEFMETNGLTFQLSFTG